MRHGKRQRESEQHVRNAERELQDRITDAQRIFRDRSRAMEQTAQQALSQIEQALGGVIRQVASSRSINMILPRGVVIFNEPPFDITAEVAQQLNRAITRVDLPPDDTAPQAEPRPQQPQQPQQQQRPAGQQGQQRRN